MIAHEGKSFIKQQYIFNNGLVSWQTVLRALLQIDHTLRDKEHRRKVSPSQKKIKDGS